VETSGEKVELAVQTTISDKGFAEKICSKFKLEDIVCLGTVLTKTIDVVIRYPASMGKKYFYAPPIKTAEFDVKIRQIWKKQKQNICCCYFFPTVIKCV